MPSILRLPLVISLFIPLLTLRIYNLMSHSTFRYHFTGRWEKDIFHFKYIWKIVLSSDLVLFMCERGKRFLMLYQWALHLKYFFFEMQICGFISFPSVAFHLLNNKDSESSLPSYTIRLSPQFSVSHGPLSPYRPHGLRNHSAFPLTFPNFPLLNLVRSLATC